MRARQALNPGRIKLTFEDGSAKYAIMERADNPVVEGHPLNPYTLLKDETCTMLGGDPETMVPDDALVILAQKLNLAEESLDKVGDVKITKRTDLGDKWVLCNGDVVSWNDYSDLFELFPTLSRLWYGSDEWSDGWATNKINSIAYGNGYWVAAGKAQSSGSYYAARIAYATDPTGEWTIKDLWSGSTACGINCIKYENGYWLAGGQAFTENVGYSARIAYAASPYDTWTTRDLWSGSDAYNIINDIVFTPNYVVAAGQSYSEAENKYAGRIAYAVVPERAVWDTKDVWSGGDIYDAINCITYSNGYLMAGGGHYENNAHSARIAYATDADAVWTTKDLWIGSTANTINGIKYANGYWLAGGNYVNGSTQSARVAYATDPTGEWTIKDLWSGSTANTINCITYANGYWIAGGQGYAGGNYDARIAYTTDLTGIWTLNDLWEGTSAYNSVNGLCYANGYYVAAGQYGSNSNYAGRKAYTDGLHLRLPAISPDECYAYIKAKE